MKQFQTSDALKRLPEQFFAKLAGKVNRYVEAGYDIINLGQGNPDQPTPDHIIKSLQKAAENPAYHKYPPFRGQPFLKQAAADFYEREFGVKLDPEKEVAVLFGGKAGLVEVSQCLLNKGDVALVPDPGYPDYWSGVAMAEADMQMMPLLEKNHFLPDYDAIPKDSLKKAKMMFLNYPNNPTAAVATKRFFEETVRFAETNDICVVHDFAYGAIGFDGERPISFLETEGAKDNGIEIYTLSKTYNMAGWRVGFAVGNQSVVESINLLQDHFYVSLFSAVQEAAAEALLGSQQCVEDLRDTYESRRNVLIQGLHDIGWNVTSPAGSFFAWLKVPESFTSESFADYLLENVQIVVAPGNGFGEYGEGYVRVGLLTSEDKLREAVERIKSLNLF
ncbi:aminotransferase class I/II-fold pyridoxal phosphate-dependent enzyme [Bacillus hwajinpoensis]|uniref:Aminotransferase class I/II-fold pyridoxal phosphate-dependent enzyme n=1 Tax=Guptibacillus hwajinpoensis TaxID=208199 RepID=A0A845F4M4_9BACL|nr:pyridoxal phosphate-dependent aminotransferase [Pseudalkalibacillus hwajinpoensis]MYL65646.1 aminotransferase class I/II-fold pyridoxal phosphate-dependent enzyme [Pseudalkalibacillus hwajinpoensis]